MKTPVFHKNWFDEMKTQILVWKTTWHMDNVTLKKQTFFFTLVCHFPFLLEQIPLQSIQLISSSFLSTDHEWESSAFFIS